MVITQKVSTSFEVQISNTVLCNPKSDQILFSIPFVVDCGYIEGTKMLLNNVPSNF